MAENHLPPALPAGARETDILAFHHVDRLLTRVQGDVRDADDRERERGQHDVVNRVRQSDIRRRNTHGNREAEREPPQLNCKKR